MSLYSCYFTRILNYVVVIISLTRPNCVSDLFICCIKFDLDIVPLVVSSLEFTLKPEVCIIKVYQNQFEEERMIRYRPIRPSDEKYKRIV